jgi:hypothetical protein
MSSERTEEFSQPPASTVRQASNEGEASQNAGDQKPSDEAARGETTVMVRGETVRDQPPQSSPKDSSSQERGASDDSARHEATVVVRGETVRDQGAKFDQAAKSDQGAKSSTKDSAPKDKDKEKSRKEVSPAKARMQSRLPNLDDDSDVGVQKAHIVIRDGKADLAFTGTLLASAAPPSAPKGQWQEYRVYETDGGKHVFSKVTRTVYAEDQDKHEAEVFDPSPSSVPSQLLRSARDLARSRPLTWMDAAVAFFGYDPLAKALYRKLGSQFEEHIS